MILQLFSLCSEEGMYFELVTREISEASCWSLTQNTLELYANATHLSVSLDSLWLYNILWVFNLALKTCIKNNISLVAPVWKESGASAFMSNIPPLPLLHLACRRVTTKHNAVEGQLKSKVIYSHCQNQKAMDVK